MYRLKSSLLVDENDPSDRSSKQSSDGVHNVSKNVENGANGGEGAKRGLWDEAAVGDLTALAAALGPAGTGDVHACMVDGEILITMIHLRLS